MGTITNLTMTASAPGTLPPGYSLTTWTGYTIATASAPSPQQQHRAAVARSLERSLRLNREAWQRLAGK
jgi:hypothetical protein